MNCLSWSKLQELRLCLALGLTVVLSRMPLRSSRANQGRGVFGFHDNILGMQWFVSLLNLASWPESSSDGVWHYLYRNSEDALSYQVWFGSFNFSLENIWPIESTAMFLTPRSTPINAYWQGLFGSGTLTTTQDRTLRSEESNQLTWSCPFWSMIIADLNRKLSCLRESTKRLDQVLSKHDLCHRWLTLESKTADRLLSISFGALKWLEHHLGRYNQTSSEIYYKQWACNCIYCGVLKSYIGN